MKLSTYILTLAVLLSPLSSFAWHDKGHQTVAAIAWDQMTPLAQARAVSLLRSAPVNSKIRALRPAAGSVKARNRTQFMRAATWPDKVRFGAREPLFHKGTWHYTDYFWEQQTPGGPKRQRPDVPPHGDLVTKLPALEASLRQLQGPSVSPSKGTDLAWFLHLMGDIAQPLHCSGRITALDAQGDQGGNLFCLTAARDREGHCLSNLHSYWDDVTEREFRGSASIGQVAAAIETRHPRTSFTSLSLGQYESWARTSQQIAMQNAYPETLIRASAPSPQYRGLVNSVSQEAIALAGYRLGETLNQVFEQ